MKGRKVLVIGGGFGGAAAARTARTLLDRHHEVTLVDRARRTHLCGSFPMLIVGEGPSAGVSRSLGSLVNRGVRFVESEVEAVDLESRSVRTSTGTLEYDYLVLAPGAAYDWSAVPGSSEAYSFYDIANATRLRRRLSSFRKGRIVIAVSGLPYKCPPAPYEAAMLLDWVFRQRGVRQDVELDVFTPEPVPIPVAGPDASARLASAMDRRGIVVHHGAAATEVAGGREVGFSDGSSVDCDLAITIPVHRAAPLAVEAGLVGESGWTDVSQETLETGSPGVYAVGDVTAVPMANGRPLPKAGVFASAEGETAGRGIAAAINGSGPAERFAGVGHCFIAYNGTQSGAVRGEFLAEGKPRVSFSPPTARGARAKERFERDWRRFRI